MPASGLSSYSAPCSPRRPQRLGCISRSIPTGGSSRTQRGGPAVRRATGFPVGDRPAAARRRGGRRHDRSAPPGLRVAGNLVLMKTRLRAAASLYIGSAAERRGDNIEIRLEDVSMKLLGESQTPLGALMASGALDLSSPATSSSSCRSYSRFWRMPTTTGSLDLMRHPKLAQNELVRARSGLTALVTVRAVETKSDHLDFTRTLPDGMGPRGRAVARARADPAASAAVPARGPG